MTDLDLNKLVAGVLEVFPGARVRLINDAASFVMCGQTLIEVSVRGHAVRVPVHEYSAEDAVRTLSTHLLHHGYSRV